MDSIEEVIELTDSNDDNPGHYIAAFFPIVKAGNPDTPHRDDKYLRMARRSRVRDQVGFINSQMYGPGEPLFFVVLYQKPGTSDFAIRLMPMDSNHGPARSLSMERFDEQDPRDYRKRITRNVWTLSHYDGMGRDRYIVNMDGKKLELAFRNDTSLCVASTFYSQGEEGTAAWKFNDGEERLNLTITNVEPYDCKAIVIPTKEQMLSNTEFGNVNFMSIEFNSMNLKGCNLPGSNFSKARVINMNFDLSKLQNSIFSSDNGEYRPDNRLFSCSYVGANLTGAKFEGTGLDTCKFDQADLTDASFKKSYIINTSFTGANLTRTSFSEIDLNQLSQLATLTLVRSVGNGTIFSKATIPYSFIGNNWQYLDLSEAKFTGTFPSGKIEAKGVMLKGSKLSGFNFTGADFTNAKLNGADLSGTNLTNANLTGADLTGANLTGATLTGAIFSGTILASTILNKANLTGATFTETPKFGRTVETRTRMQETIVHISFLQKDWSYLDLTSIKFTTTDAPPKPLKADYVILDNVNFHHADLEGANFEFAQLKKVQFSSAVLKNAKMMSAVLIGGTFTNANMWGTNLTNADLTSAKFEGVDLFNASVKGATVVNTWFNDAYLAAMDFSDIKGKALQGCNFSYACLVNAKFNNTRIGAFGDQNSSFANASLHGAQFEGADLKGVNLTDAFIVAQEGVLKATIRAMDSEQSLMYDPTKIQAKATDSQTICPNGTSGPCTVPQMKSSKTFTNTWAHKKTVKEMEA
jgi:uncharacterized protein YjbI with pentapeptide repeats